MIHPINLILRQPEKNILNRKKEKKKLIKHRPICLNPKLRHFLEVRKWRKENPEKDKTSNRKHQSKRRGLGFIPLNKPFAGSQPHHIDKSFVIYIPKEIHASIPHNVWTGEGMDEINALAINLLIN